MNAQRHDQQINDPRHDQPPQEVEPVQVKTKRDLPGVGGQRDRQQHADFPGKDK
jgi:hypothetical protein